MLCVFSRLFPQRADRWRLRVVPLVVLVCATLSTSLAHGQSEDDGSSRRAALQAAREAKTDADLAPKPRTRLESTLLWVEENNIPLILAGALQTPVRVLPGGIGPETGIGGRLAYVPFFRRDDLDVFLAAGGSHRGYWALEATAGYRQPRWFGYSYARWRDRRDRFTVTAQNTRLLDDGFSIGNEIRYDVADLTTGGVVGLRPTPALTLAVGGAYAQYDPNPDPNNQYDEPGGPSIPFSEQTRYTGVTAHLIWDTRDARYERGFGERYTPNTDALTDRPLSPHTGTLLTVEGMRFFESTNTDGDFAQLTVEAQQYLSFWSKYHTLALRHRTVLTDPDNRARVPFYQLPYLGGAHTLRGYDTFRFRDLHALVYNVEYRWQVWLMADLVLFADAGKTFDEATAWGLTNLQTSVGGGLRIATGRSTLVRLEVARSPEDVRFIVRFSSSF